MKITLDLEIYAGDSLQEVIDKLENIVVRLPKAKFSYGEDLQLDFDEEQDQ